MKKFANDRDYASELKKFFNSDELNSYLLDLRTQLWREFREPPKNWVSVEVSRALYYKLRQFIANRAEYEIYNGVVEDIITKEESQNISPTPFFPGQHHCAVALALYMLFTDTRYEEIHNDTTFWTALRNIVTAVKPKFMS